MRLAHAIAVLLAAPACAFHPSGTGGDDVSTDGGTDDGGNRIVTLRDDVASDFGMAGHQLDTAVIEPWGAIGPAAYLHGAMASGFANEQRFTDATTATWAQVVGTSRDGASLWAGALIADPIGVGHEPGTGDWTYWVEGELFLRAGANPLVLRADDAAFLDVAADGATFARVATATFAADGSDSVTVDADGWYPVRMAMQQGVGEARLILLVRDASNNLVVPGRDRLRARTDGLRGLYLVAWASQHFNAPIAGLTLDTTLLANRDFASAAPPGVGLTDPNNWSLRWIGQLHVEVAGEYDFRYRSDDGQHLYLGGAQRTSDWDVAAVVTHDARVTLEAGWNDLAVDLNENTGGASAQLQQVAGPDGVTGALPLDRLRPLEPRSERIAAAVEPNDALIPTDPAGVDGFLDVGGFAGTTITTVDLEVRVDHGNIGELEIRLLHPDGTTLLLRDNDNSGGNGARTFRYFDLTQLAGKPAPGRYNVRITDTRGNQTGSRANLALVVHARGGPEQVARTASFTSAVRDLGPGVVAIDSVRFAARTPAASTIGIRLRGCDDPDACASQPWSMPFTDPAGGPTGLSPRRYLQYRVDLTSDGDREPELDWVQVDYRLPPG